MATTGARARFNGFTLIYRMTMFSFGLGRGQFSAVLALVAVLAVAVSAAPSRDIEQTSAGNGNEGSVHGALNNVIKGGVLADESTNVMTNQDA
ncbi:uncharacterized protein BYT42DRAFT_643544 [Radiomyces spectabilis]|uniref:uncharacterized protein n=1 Tax=Radiomyces spectabilis TaxID=64574 RepID=UPI00221F6874|nr:uncharacterized protein BYT42DRAFT_643544 [Radiomyces spectabilis]KAI8384785.1 hypothetical protein BYT42DRAFT_643544 [Radiomyces spectabilis]